MDDETLVKIITSAWGGILLVITNLQYKVVRGLYYLGMCLMIMLPFAVFFVLRFGQLLS